ncbi:MAG: hypothetical protein M1478_01910 [Deltaproteobacteria bacterium]|jgi:hypothetical protein|nr:hypothetical protein [Deltaproteobacteria bacterium]MCL5879573.1 hypothetical protein [Deltaproteobacteria bacterium]
MEKKYFIPERLPVKIDYDDLIADIVSANKALSRLDALLSYLPNPELLGRMYIPFLTGQCFRF